MHACMHTNSHTYITLQYMAWHYITLQYIHTNFHTIRVHMHAEIQAGAHIKIKDKLDFTLHYSRARLHCLGSTYGPGPGKHDPGRRLRGPKMTTSAAGAWRRLGWLGWMRCMDFLLAYRELSPKIGVDHFRRGICYLLFEFGGG